MNETIKNVVSNLTKQREALDAFKTAINELPKSRGTSLAYTTLEKSRMYIGEICRELGKEYPYEATKKANTPEGIQEAVDRTKTIFKLSDNEIINLNNLREVLEKELDYFLQQVFHPEKGLIGNRTNLSITNKFVIDCNISEAYRGLKEARMYLGIRLGEIRDNAKIIQNGK